MTVRLEVEDGLAQLVLARPDRGNGLDLEMARRLVDALGEVEARADVRAVLVRAEGPHFCVGGDLGHVGGGGASLGKIAAAMIEPAQELVARAAELRVPVVCAAGGGAAGLGLGILYAADVVIAGDDLKLATAFAAVGVSGDGGSSWFLPRIVGLRRAQELMLLNRRLSAAEALQWGLVTRVVPRAELDDAALEVAGALAAGPTVALAGMRRLLREATGPSLREHLAAEAEAVLACARSADMAEALTAFGEKRHPVFTGT